MKQSDRTEWRNTISTIVGDFKTPHFIMNKTTRQDKGKDDLKNIINQ